MKIALGLKAHSGWAGMVAVGMDSGALCVVDRRRIELVDDPDQPWVRQPYHAAEGLEPPRARAVVERGIADARRLAVDELRAAVARAREADHDVAACAVLVGEPMPAWSVEEFLAVHFRMHKAEGVLYKDALVTAVGTCGLRLVEVSEKQLANHGKKALGTSAGALTKEISDLGKTVGAPWGKDQKDATLAAVIALRGKTA